MKKKLLTLLLGTALVMGLAACGGGDDEREWTRERTGTDTATR